jgi:hypothetical protein
MCFRSHHWHLESSTHHHHVDAMTGEGGSSLPTGLADHGISHTAWSAHSALLGDGGTAVVTGNIDIAGTQFNLADAHVGGSGVLDTGHGVTAVISGNVDNGGIQINLIEVQVGPAAPVLPPH